MSKSYTQVASDHKLIDIVEYLHQQNSAVTAAEVARALGMAHGTVMSHLATLLDRKWIRLDGDRYEPGPRIPGMWASYKMGLEHKIGKLQAELKSLEA
jgi:DNA-binding IclR family transcriptional regulator